MSKQKMLAARELIQEKRYAEARALLKTVDNPTASVWLKKLDEVEPPIVISATPTRDRLVYETFLKQWAEVEKTILLVGAFGLVLFAGYLAVADPFRNSLTFLLFDKPEIRDAVITSFPLLSIALAMVAIWRSTQNRRIQQTLLKMNPGQLRAIAVKSMLLTFVWVGLGVMKSDQPRLPLGICWALIAIFHFWRASKAAKLQSLGITSNQDRISPH